MNKPALKTIKGKPRKQLHCSKCAKLYYRVDFLKIHESKCGGAEPVFQPSSLVEENIPIIEAGVKGEALPSEAPADDIEMFLKDELDYSDFGNDGELEEDEEIEEEPEDLNTNPLETGGAFRLKDILFPDHREIPEEIMKYSAKLEIRMPVLMEGYCAKVYKHEDMYLELMKRNNVGDMGKLPYMNTELSDKTALLGLTARDLTTTLIGNWGNKKLDEKDKEFTPKILDEFIAKTTKNLTRGIEKQTYSDSESSEIEELETDDEDSVIPDYIHAGDDP